jgi:error-prone DNA polymerase
MPDAPRPGKTLGVPLFQERLMQLAIAMSFAYLVYASAWLKRYHPAAFCAALLNAQPMGFYSPQSLVDDARRHGVTVLRPGINVSNAKAVLHTTPDTRRAAEPGEPPQRWGRGGPIVRLGLSSVRALGDDVAQRIQDERHAGGPFRDMVDLVRRARLSTAHLEALATADAFACFGLMCDSQRILVPGGRLALTVRIRPGRSDWPAMARSVGLEVEDSLVLQEHDEFWGRLHASWLAHESDLRTELGDRAADNFIVEAQVPVPGD